MAGGKHKALSGKTTGVQYAALPWRFHHGEVQILLVTSRRTRRWIIPKGWPMDRIKPPAAAAREALEEAGVSGEIETQSNGCFRYAKLLRNGHEMACRVEVFPLKVTKESSNWAEMDARARRWVSVSEAAEAVREPQLKAIIRRFGTRMAATGEQGHHGRHPT